MKVLLTLLFIAVVVVGGFAVLRAEDPDSSWSPFAYPTSSWDFARGHR